MAINEKDRFEELLNTDRKFKFWWVTNKKKNNRLVTLIEELVNGYRSDLQKSRYSIQMETQDKEALQNEVQSLKEQVKQLSDKHKADKKAEAMQYRKIIAREATKEAAILKTGNEKLIMVLFQDCHPKPLNLTKVMNAWGINKSTCVGAMRNLELKELIKRTEKQQGRKDGRKVFYALTRKGLSLKIDKDFSDSVTEQNVKQQDGVTLI